MRTFRKDPDEKISIGFDWSEREKIASSSWEIDAGLDAESGTFGDDYADVVVYGGTVDTQYNCTNTVTTADGLIYQRSLIVQVVDR
jgi:hypothetical protein